MNKIDLYHQICHLGIFLVKIFKKYFFWKIL